MKRYAKWAPTAFDIKGLNAEDAGEDGESRADWFVAPVSITRDTPPGSLDRSNWEVLKAQLSALPGEDFEVHRFGHWACGWFEIILVRPGTKAAEVAQAAEDKIADYPALNEDDWSQREWEAHDAGLCEDGCSCCESDEQAHRTGFCQADCGLCYEEAEKEDFARE